MTAVGITATRLGLTPAQMGALGTILAELRTLHGYDTFRHGDCIGGDERGHDIAVRLGYKTVSHPPDNPRLRAFTANDETLAERPYLQRNRAITDASATLIGCPDGPERDRSGTWSTIRYARRTHHQVIVIMPDGSVA